MAGKKFKDGFMMVRNEGNGGAARVPNQAGMYDFECAAGYRRPHSIWIHAVGPGSTPSFILLLFMQFWFGVDQPDQR
jgi:hypothetical protein